MKLILTKKYINLKQLSTFYNESIVDRSYDYDKKAKIKRFIDQITQKEVSAMMEEMFLKRRKVFEIHVVS